MFPNLLKQESFLCSFQKYLNHVHAWVVLWNKWPDVVIWAVPGVFSGLVSRLLTNSGSPFLIHFPYCSLPEFLIFSWLFLYAVVMIFGCNVYEAFLYVFSSKTNVKNAPSLPALLDFCACWMQVSHMNTSVCVKLIHSFVTVHACWTFSYCPVSAH